MSYTGYSTLEAISHLTVTAHFPHPRLQPGATNELVGHGSAPPGKLAMALALNASEYISLEQAEPVMSAWVQESA